MDQESGFYFYNARYYDASIARFVTPDSIVDGVEDTQGWNRLSYVRGNPINAKDPTGHETLKEKNARMMQQSQINILGKRDNRAAYINPPENPSLWEKVKSFGVGVWEGLRDTAVAFGLIMASGIASPIVGILFFLGGVAATADGFDIVVNGRKRHDDDDGYSGVSTLTRWQTAGNMVGGFLLFGRGAKLFQTRFNGKFGVKTAGISSDPGTGGAAEPSQNVSPPVPDFYASEKGTAIPGSQKVMETGFEKTGIKSTPSNNGDGKIYNVDTQNGKVEVRSMPGEKIILKEQ